MSLKFHLSVIALCLSTLLLSPAPAHASDFVKNHREDLGVFSDSGIFGPTYPEFEAAMKDLARTYPNLVEDVVYGTSIEGRALHAIKIHRRDLGYGSIVLITGGHHGNEYLNIEDRLPLWIAQNEPTKAGLKNFFDKGGALYIVPFFNPDGYVHRERYNANGVDLNRDYDLAPSGHRGFTQPETASFNQFITLELKQKDAQFRVSLDYHCCQGSVLYPWSYEKRDLPQEHLTAYRDFAKWMINLVDPNYISGTPYETVGYFADGTTIDYYYSLYSGGLYLAFEGTYEAEKSNFLKHAQMWEEILGRY